VPNRSNSRTIRSKPTARQARRVGASAVAASVALALTACSSGPAATVHTGPPSVAILIGGFGSSLPASTYNPLTQTSAALSVTEKTFDPSPSSEPPGCQAEPNMTTTLHRAGTMILPFSYNGVHVTGTSAHPTVTVAAYPSSAPSTTLPQTVAPAVATEVNQVHALWPAARIVVVGHSEGGYLAEQYFLKDFSASRQPQVSGIFSLDSPINGIKNESLVATLLNAIKFPASTALLDQFQASWNNAPANDAAILAKEAKKSVYVPVGTPNDNVYRIADDPAAGLISQVLVGSNGQPLGSGSPNLIDPAAPPVAGLSDPLAVLASHQCVMASATVIKAIAARLPGRATG
jgi:pimeloyl-ACP methyl ester carboxylesterase